VVVVVVAVEVLVLLVVIALFDVMMMIDLRSGSWVGSVPYMLSFLDLIAFTYLEDSMSSKDIIGPV